MKVDEISSLLNKFRNCIVHFPRFNAAHSILLNAIEDTNTSGEPYGAILCAKSGVGKTTLCFQVMGQFKEKYSAEVEGGVDLCASVIYFEVPSEVTIKGMPRKMLIALGIENPKGSTEEMTQQLIHLLKQRRVELVFLDEINRLCVGTAKKIRPQTLGWIASFINALGKPVIISGTEECVDIRRHLDSFATRFPYQVNMEFFSYSEDPSSEYIRTLQKLDEAISTITKLNGEINIHDPAIALNLYLATAGNLGWLRKVLFVALKRCLLRDDGKGLKLADFHYACELLSLDTRLTPGNPFSLDPMNSFKFLYSKDVQSKIQEFRITP
ncbi:TniB family NTP-binding protein [Pseudomonas sp. USTB-Z]|uniref:TniB family NTP-binding protein n=1 Tax=unclassified Pseudomonas TaxID=196821 RepID=UPI001C83A507|nr:MULTISPECIES: TniB family NTP-binding protein [unclassified Pseudomonas]MBX6691905.1 TniB family NTP-binding protein [Pseudomonas sp. USTB-Z]MDH0707781.1 TniB family NTP-binding protein [Pseudomonas sp. GD03862]